MTQQTATHVPLPGSRRFQRPGAEVLGRADRLELAEVTVKVRRKQALPEPSPDNPISQADLVTNYGADPADLTRVERVLSGFGLKVTSRLDRTRTIKLIGPVSKMEEAFGVNLFRAKHENVLYRARTGEVQIPSALKGIVTGVFGLDTRPMAKRRRSLGLSASKDIPPPDQRTWFLPQELAKAYDFPIGTGKGETVAILEFGGRFIPEDLSTFVQVANLPAKAVVNVKNVHHLSASERNDEDATGEVMLDVEVVAGVCPEATIALYFSKWSEQGWVDSLDAVLMDAGTLSTVSISYGLAEGDEIWTAAAMSHVSDSLKELANSGLTVCVSSGDDGSEDQVPDGAAHIDFPATSPYVLAVGGTALDRSTGSEFVWFDGDGLRRDGGGSTGGGVSQVFPKPAWQTANIPSVNNPHAAPGRIVPDVAANAAGSTGYLLIANGEAEVSGGTSAAAPLWAALIALLRASGKTVGFLPPRLYAPTPKTQGKPLGQVAFRDILDGKNASGTAAGYFAGVGFDAVSGWGSPDGGKLLDLIP